jgi:DMSO/TMAO reductase YedYZ molybdopterin-dependent catalytic subunit
VLHAGSVPDIDLATWDLTIDGEVERPLTLTWEQLLELPSREITVDIHCVTRLEPVRHDLQGSALERAREARLPEAERALRRRARRAGLHRRTSRLPPSRRRPSLVAYEADGEPLTKDHGWPVRLVVPTRYFWKSAKWLRGLQLLDHDEPGFWERYGYNNNADFNKEERYSF